MEYLWIGFDRNINVETIMGELKQKLGLSKCYEYNLETLPELLESLSLENIREDKTIIFYEVKRNLSEFPLNIEIPWIDDAIFAGRIDAYIAYYLSNVFDCRTITDGSWLEPNGNTSYWDIVFDSGKAYLVDDLETNFYGDGIKQERFVRQLYMTELFGENYFFKHKVKHEQR